MKLRKTLLVALLTVGVILGCFLVWKYVYQPRKAEQALALALQYVDSGEYLQALPHAMLAAEYFPDRYPAQRALALSLLGSGRDTIRALEHLGLAYGLDSSDYSLGLLYSRTLRDVGEAQRSMDVLDGISLRFPDSAEVFFQRAITLAALSRLDDSYAEYLRAIELEGTNIVALQQQENHQARMAAFSQVISSLARKGDAIANSAEGYAQRGLFRVKIQDFAHAVEDLHMARAMGKNGRDIIGALSVSYMNLGSADSALLYANQAIDMSNTVDSLYKVRALIYIRAGKSQEALADLDKMVSSGVSDGSTYYLRGIANTQLSRYPQAIKDYTKTIELRPDLSEAYFNRGVVYAYEGHFDRAVKDYSVVIGRLPNYIEPVLARGIAYINQDRFEEGCVDLHWAAEHGNEEAKKMLPTYCR